VPCIQNAIKPLGDQIAGVEKDVQAMKNVDLPMLKQANRDSLRNQLFASYRHCVKVGYRTLEDTENWEYMYNSYIDLGGNGFIPTLREQFLRIPMEDFGVLKVTNTKEKK